MFQEVVTGTGIIYYLMILVGTVGVLAKLMNQISLRSLVKAAANMPKSTHKLIKLVRSKYEHACMLHERVENVEAFVGKYIYEYRGILFRIHTWRQIQIQAIWFAGIIAMLGAFGWYLKSDWCEEVFRYLAMGAAEMVILFVVSQLSDEHHKLMRIQNYMVDYLENVCVVRQRRVRQAEREQINVIQTESSQAKAVQAEGALRAAQEVDKRGKDTKKEEKDLSIRIEGEPRKAPKGSLAKKVFGRQEEKETEEVQSTLQEETIRKILEEFLA